ncbi:MAG: hypothetical protein DRP74_07855 [Candidatus Omnitrophota bacterium]|nr:MAG: hypothetical protein DRP74_07855 [Candidatus Omnitrophota bacterium]
MMQISFTKALPLFVITLTFIYLILLIASEKEHKGPRTEIRKLHKNLMLAALILTMIAFALLHIPDYKLTIYYQVIVTLAYFTLLFCMAIPKNIPNNYSKYFLFTTILIHLLIVYNPPYGLYFGEWTRTLTKTIIDSHYEIVPYRFTYNPFPFHVGLWVAFSEITHISIILKISKFFPPLITLIVIDLVLYVLARRLTGSWLAGILAILMLASTPPANFLDHNAKLAGLMLVLIMTLALIKAYEGQGTLSNGVIAVLAYASGLFYHATAGLGMFVIAGILVFGLIMRILTKEYIWRRPYESKIMQIFLIIIIAITLTKWGWGGGAEKIVPSLYRNFLAMIEWRQPSEAGAPAPLYERMGVNPIQAYPWAVPVAITSALLLYILLRRKSLCNPLIPALAVGGLTFLLLGFSSAYFRTGFAASMYPGYGPLMLPSAVVLCKLLNSRRLIISILVVMLLTASATIALKDPMNIPGGWIRFKGFVIAGEEHYILTSLIHNFSTPEYKRYLTRELVPTLGYLDPYAQAKGIIYEPTDPKYQKDYQIIQGKLEFNAIYVFRLKQIQQHFSSGSLGNTRVNVFLNNGKYIGLIKVE